jgi:hypothetical protein
VENDKAFTTGPNLTALSAVLGVEGMLNVPA